ncbi:MAG: glycosyltransferase family 4 protein [Bacteroidales bacterium]|nr:glycosyltransferase family 4 protein [Bacteroidales bacterium]
MGDAYTNRILSLAKGLIRTGVNVKIFIIYPGKDSRVVSKKGVFDQVPYEYLTPLRTSKNKVIKKLIGAKGIANTCYNLLTKDKNTDAIISFAESPVQNSIISFFAHLKKILFIREANEYPKELLTKGKGGLSAFDDMKIRNSLKSLDGLICISRSLKDYFQAEYSFKKPVLIIPIVVDKTRFGNEHIKINDKYISYCGNLFGEKDGVDILVKAFAKISLKHSFLRLKLIGDISNAIEFEKLKFLVNSLNISDKVDFTGYLDRDEIPFHLINSYILVLARPDNIQAQGGFPTKLGEYLATSKPVVVTAVGDIPQFLKDGVNAFLALPGDVNSFSEKLTYVIENYSVAQKAGNEGHKLVDKDFSPDYQATRIVGFINGLAKTKEKNGSIFPVS